MLRTFTIVEKKLLTTILQKSLNRFNIKKMIMGWIKAVFFKKISSAKKPNSTIGWLEILYVLQLVISYSELRKGFHAIILIEICFSLK